MISHSNERNSIVHAIKNIIADKNVKNPLELNKHLFISRRLQLAIETEFSIIERNLIIIELLLLFFEKEYKVDFFERQILRTLLFDRI